MATPTKLENVNYVESTLHRNNTSNDDRLTSQIRGSFTL